MKPSFLRQLVPSALVLAAVLPAGLRAQTFTYANFASSSGLKLNGNATAPATGQDGSTPVLRLTPAQFSQAGSAFSLNAVQLGSNASFSTAFSFQMWGGNVPSFNDGNSPPNPFGADGIVFVLNTGSNSVGSSGQGVGYQGIANSIGIKFDTWQDGSGNGFPQDNDPNGNFVAIYADGSTHYYDAANPSDPNNNLADDATSYYTPTDSMKDGGTWYAWVDYNGVTDDLQVRLSEVDVRPVSAILDETIDLNSSSILGNAPAVYAGFTSGTGSAYDNNDVLSWQFNDSYNPIGQVGGVPDGGPGLPLFAAVLAALALLAPRALRPRTQAS